MNNEDLTMREKLFHGWKGCTNHGCIVHGNIIRVGTNGMCQCVVNASRTSLMMLQSRLSVILKEEEG